MKVAIVDDHPLVRQGLISILKLEKYEIVGEATNIIEGINIIKEREPDITIVDLKLGNECGLDLIYRCKDKTLGKFVVLTSSTSLDDFVKAQEANVDGYVLKEALPDEFIYAVNLVSKGRKYYDPILLEYKIKEDAKGKELEHLTPREQDVLEALGRGLNNEQISKELFITRHTVKKHVSQILAKLDLQDRTQAALYASQKLTS